MSFTDRQLRRLRAKLPQHYIKERQAEGIILHYLEGWHVIAEANRIFGFAGWDRETVHSQCVWTKQLGSRFTAAYIVRIRITVRAEDVLITREGSGAGEATSLTPGQAHELAAKAAETDATKRALATFGNAFGLSLYGTGIAAEAQAAANERAKESTGTSPTNSASPHAARIDKSALNRFEPKRLRDLNHLAFVNGKPCLVCGRQPSHAHHLTFVQPRALGRKASDEFTIPLCNLHPCELHDRGDERAWWTERNVNPLPIASPYGTRVTAGQYATHKTSPAQQSIRIPPVRRKHRISKRPSRPKRMV